MTFNSDLSLDLCTNLQMFFFSNTGLCLVHWREPKRQVTCPEFCRQTTSGYLAMADTLDTLMTLVSSGVTVSPETSETECKVCKSATISRTTRKGRHANLELVKKRFVWVPCIVDKTLLEVFDQEILNRIKFGNRPPRVVFDLKLSQRIISCISGCNSNDGYFDAEEDRLSQMMRKAENPIQMLMTPSDGLFQLADAGDRLVQETGVEDGLTHGTISQIVPRPERVVLLVVHEADEGDVEHTLLHERIRVSNDVDIQLVVAMIRREHRGHTGQEGVVAGLVRQEPTAGHEGGDNAHTGDVVRTKLSQSAEGGEDGAHVERLERDQVTGGAEAHVRADGVEPHHVVREAGDHNFVIIWEVTEADVGQLLGEVTRSRCAGKLPIMDTISDEDKPESRNLPVHGGRTEMCLISNESVQWELVVVLTIAGRTEGGS